MDKQDLVDVPERLVIFRSDSEDKEEPAKRRKVQMETEKVGDPSDLNTKVPAESVAIQLASSLTPETSRALLTAKKFVIQIKRYKQQISIVHPNAESTSAASTSFASAKNSKPIPEFNFIPSDHEQEEEPVDNYNYRFLKTTSTQAVVPGRRRSSCLTLFKLLSTYKLGREYNDSHLCCPHFSSRSIFHQCRKDFSNVT